MRAQSLGGKAASMAAGPPRQARQVLPSGVFSCPIRVEPFYAAGPDAEIVEKAQEGSILSLISAFFLVAQQAMDRQKGYQGLLLTQSTPSHLYTLNSSNCLLVAAVEHS